MISKRVDTSYPAPADQVPGEVTTLKLRSGLGSPAVRYSLLFALLLSWSALALLTTRTSPFPIPRVLAGKQLPVTNAAAVAIRAGQPPAPILELLAVPTTIAERDSDTWSIHVFYVDYNTQAFCRSLPQPHRYFGCSNLFWGTNTVYVNKISGNATFGGFSLHVLTWREDNILLMILR